MLSLQVSGRISVAADDQVAALKDLLEDVGSMELFTVRYCALAIWSQWRQRTRVTEADYLYGN